MEKLEIHITKDDSPSWDTSNALSFPFPAIPDFNGSEHDTDGIILWRQILM